VSATRPYDVEREDEVWVALTPLEWSVIVAAVERSNVAAALDPAMRLHDQLIATQVARMRADIRDAEYDREGM
jgi:hypothetical protein